MQAIRWGLFTSLARFSSRFSAYLSLVISSTPPDETLTERKLQALLAAREGLVSTAGNNNPLSPRPANVQQRKDATGST